MRLRLGKRRSPDGDCPSRHLRREGHLIYATLLAAAILVTAIGLPQSATGQAPKRPTVYVVAPERQCEKITVYTSSGKKTTRLAPPAPGLRAVGQSPRRIRVFWRFATFPRACRPAIITLGITRYGAARATPEIARKRVDALKGSAILSYRPFLPPPDIAFASAITAKRHYSSRDRSVLIRK